MRRQPVTTVECDPASCSHVGGHLMRAAAQLAELDAYPELSRDVDALGRALQRYAVVMGELTSPDDAAVPTLERADPPTARLTVVGPTPATVGPDHPESGPGGVRDVTQRAARARRRLRLVARQIT